MTPGKRIALILFLAAAFYAVAIARVILMQVLVHYRMEPLVAYTLGFVVQAAICAFPLLFWKGLRDVGTFHLTRSRTVLLALPSPLLYLIFASRPPGPLWAIACLVLVAVATGFSEELVLRGYAFRRAPERHPRLVILLSALCFALMHWHYNPNAPGQVLVVMFITFVGGIALGIVRFVSGSLGWCVVMHSLLDVAAPFILQSHRVLQQQVCLAAHAVIFITVMIVLLKHPKLRSVPIQDRDDESALPSADGRAA